MRSITIIAMMMTVLSVLLCSCRHDPRPAGDVAAVRTEADTLLARALRYVYKPGEEKADLDSAILLTLEAHRLLDGRHDTIREGRVFFTLGNAYDELGIKDTALHYIDSSIALLMPTAAYADLGEAYVKRSYFFSDFSLESSIRTKESCFEKASAEFERAGSKERQAFALQNIGDIQMLFGEDSASMVSLKRALALYAAVNYKKVQGVYDLLGYISTGMGDCPTAIKYGRLAVKTAEENGDTTMQLCTICNRLALAYTNNNDPVNAEQYYKRAISIAQQYADRTAIYGILPHYVKVMCTLGRQREAVREIYHSVSLIPPVSMTDSMRLYISYASTYVSAREYDQASSYVEWLMKVLNHKYPVFQNIYFLDPAYHCVLAYLMDQHQYHEADRYITQYADFCQRTSYRVGFGIVAKVKSQIDSALGNYHEALVYFHQHKFIADSLAAESRRMQVAQLQVQYETDKKDQDLRFKQQDIELLTNKSQLQDANLKKATIIRNVIIVAAILLLAFGVIAYRIKQRHNTQLEAQQAEIHEQNEQLKDLLAGQQKLVREKEWLVKEIHHRVKNNLQIIISLLNAQADFLHDPSALDAIRESRERMQAVALIHQKLYQPDHSTEISMKAYISEMVSYLSSSFTDISRIRFVLDIDDIDLDVSQSVPLGLILNEAITNAIKYAFPEGSSGTVAISLKAVSDQDIRLLVADDGRGFPAGFDTSGSTSLGMQLISLFSEQLDGQLSFHSEHGVELSLLFRRAKTAL